MPIAVDLADFRIHASIGILQQLLVPLPASLEIAGMDQPGPRKSPAAPVPEYPIIRQNAEFTWMYRPSSPATHISERSVLEHPAEPLFAFPQLPLGPQARADVPGDG